jgi:hypothetical protein
MTSQCTKKKQLQREREEVLDKRFCINRVGKLAVVDMVYLKA